ncbi:MAG: hypothetical protein AB1627_16455 [Chloroflexota bacterium]
MRLFGKQKTEVADLAASVLLARQADIKAFMAIGELSRHVVEAAWSGDFLRERRDEFLSSTPDTRPIFSAFVKVTAAGGMAITTDADVDAVNVLWQGCWNRGYFLGLARLHLESEQLGRTPRHRWLMPPLASVSQLWEALARRGASPDRELGWLSHGALAPFSQPVILGALEFVATQYENRLWPHYPAGGPRLAVSEGLAQSAASGYAFARAQQETTLMTEYLARLT